MAGIRRVEYYYIAFPNRTGEGAKIVNALKAEQVNLIALNGFPTSTTRAQLVLVPSNPEALFTAAQKIGLKVVGPKIAFLIQGRDRVGAVSDVFNKLAQARINITAAQAVATGEGLYGAILWVKPRSIARAAKVLGIS
jgi:hypothetical protein